MWNQWPKTPHSEVSVKRCDHRALYTFCMVGAGAGTEHELAQWFRQMRDVTRMFMMATGN